MLKPLALLAAIGFSAASFGVIAEETDHYAGKPAENLEQAVKNFNQYNKRLEKALQTEDMDAIHQLTYTLENALARMDSELEQMAIDLEEVHIGSEDADSKRVNKHAERYLDSANTLKMLGQ